MWTREVLSKFFQIDAVSAAPPRSALKKFGGPFTLSEFYGEDAHQTRFVEIHSAPFVSFAMYAEIMQSTLKARELENQNDEEGIRQPLLRTDPIAKQECTQQPSLLIEYLKRLALSSSSGCTFKKDDEDPQKSVHSKYLADDQDEKKIRKMKKTDAPKTVLKRAKKLELQDAANGNKTRSLLSYAQKNE
jgi:hypothetical protein